MRILASLFLALFLALALAGCASPGMWKLNAGVDAMNRGDLVGAEALTQEALRIGLDHSDRAIAINNLGAIAARRGDVQGAVNAWILAARLGDPTAQQNLLAAGVPIPTPDLAPVANSGASDAALLLLLSGQQSRCTHRVIGDTGYTNCR